MPPSPSHAPRAMRRRPPRRRSCRPRSPADALERLAHELVGELGQILVWHGHAPSLAPNQLHRRERGLDLEVTIPLADLHGPPAMEAQQVAQFLRDDNAAGRIDGSSHGVTIPFPMALAPSPPAR